MKIFEILPENFFSIFASNINNIYADCIFLMFNFFGKGNSFGADKEEVVSILSEYFNTNQYYFIDDETDEVVRSSRAKALSILRKLRRTGWIFEEDDINYEVRINFNYYTIPIINTLLELKQNKALEYRGYIYLIYSTLKNIDEDTFGDLIYQIYDATNRVMYRLKGLNANIKKYINDLLNKKEVDDLQSIVENLFIDYKKNIIDESYQRLKTSDNVSKFRPFIISKLNEIILNDAFINKVCLDLVHTDKFNTIDLAKLDLFEKIESIISNFENLDNIIDEIDKKNSRYIQMSISKILFIVSNSIDLQGKINSILKYIIDHHFDDLSLFKLSIQRNLDKNSLYTNSIRVITKPQKLKLKKSMSHEEKTKRLNKLLENGLYSKKSINKYMIGLLKNKKSIKASEIKIGSFSDYTRLILIYMYSKSNNIDYKIIKLDSKQIINNFEFTDFEIYRRGKDE
ncbi:MAG: hypothetical protein K0Q49_746 [Haloplasmataceae bacterium]|nr:hypothetical protein [Haloplasmataceae bacterium]